MGSLGTGERTEWGHGKAGDRKEQREVADSMAFGNRTRRGGEHARQPTLCKTVRPGLSKLPPFISNTGN